MKLHLQTDRVRLYHGDAARASTVIAPESVDAIVTDPPSGIGFMGKDWDKDKGGRDRWIAWLAGILRSAMTLLKPGGYALVWGLPRTSHWTATAVEDAGFEVCDKLVHLNGQGFPKSIDMARQIDMHFCELPGRHFDKTLPKAKLRDGDHLCPEHAARAPGVGIGSGLKPSAEDWILAQKPFRGTYAENFLRWGTGGLRIDDCRILVDGERPWREPADPYKTEPSALTGGSVAVEPTTVGRWPANVTLDEDSAAALDEQTGELVSGATPTGDRDGSQGAVYGASTGPRCKTPREGNTGGASRFFYVAKPCRSEKDAGLDHLPLRTGGEATDREDGSAALNSPRSGAGRGGGARNHHPTVKSVELMRYLCRLVTPRGGTVLDLFAGSGTTGLAATSEGLKFIGFEQDAAFADVAAGRLAHVEFVEPPPRIEIDGDAPPPQLSLFGA